MTNEPNVATELLHLRGDMREGFARIEGQLNLITQSQAQTAADIDKLDKRVTALEERRIPIGMLAAVSGAVSAVIAAVALMLQL